MELIVIAQFRVSIDPGLYLYHFDHLGSCVHVRGNKLHYCCADVGFLQHIRRLYPQVSLAKALVFSNCS